MIDSSAQDKARIGRLRVPRNQPQLRIPRFLDTHFVSLLLTIFGIAMGIGGLLLIIADATLPMNADAARSTSFFAIQNVDHANCCESMSDAPPEFSPAPALCELGLFLPLGSGDPGG